MHFGPWQECPDGTLFQIIYVPHMWLKPGDAVPNCSDCGTPFKKTHAYPSMVGFEANCTGRHDPELSDNLDLVRSPMSHFENGGEKRIHRQLSECNGCCVNRA